MTACTLWRRMISSTAGGVGASATWKWRRPAAEGRRASIASACPRKRLSRMTTVWPSRSRRCAAWEPIYPAPPVTRTFMPLTLEHLGQHDDPDDEQAEGDGQQVEVFLDERADRGPEEPEQGGDAEKEGGAPDEGSEHERAKRDGEETGRDREQFVRMDRDGRAREEERVGVEVIEGVEFVLAEKPDRRRVERRAD